MVYLALKKRADGTMPTLEDLAEEYDLANYRELLAKFPPDWTIQQISQVGMDSAEALAIACKSDIVPLKNVDQNLFRKGVYVGNNPLIESLIGIKQKLSIRTQRDQAENVGSKFVAGHLYP